jgi:hypothetical protein
VSSAHAARARRAAERAGVRGRRRRSAPQASQRVSSDVRRRPPRSPAPARRVSRPARAASRERAE